MWPVTLLVVLCAFLLSAWNLYGAMITTAPFFGDPPSRRETIEAGLMTLTGIVPCVLFALAGWIAGSRWGLGAIALPVVALASAGFGLLAEEGDPDDPEPTRAVRFADVFGDLTYLNWIVAGGLVVLIGGVVWTRRRGRG